MKEANWPLELQRTNNNDYILGTNNNGYIMRTNNVCVCVCARVCVSCDAHIQCICCVFHWVAFLFEFSKTKLNQLNNSQNKSRGEVLEERWHLMIVSQVDADEWVMTDELHIRKYCSGNFRGSE